MLAVKTSKVLKYLPIYCSRWLLSISWRPSLTLAIVSWSGLEENGTHWMTLPFDPCVSGPVLISLLAEIGSSEQASKFQKLKGSEDIKRSQKNPFTTRIIKKRAISMDYTFDGTNLGLPAARVALAGVYILLHRRHPLLIIFFWMFSLIFQYKVRSSWELMLHGSCLKVAPARMNTTRIY